MGLLFHWFSDSSVHLVSCAWILSCHFIGISSNICRFVDAPHELQHSIAPAFRNLSYRPLTSYDRFFFPKPPPRHGPGTIWYPSSIPPQIGHSYVQDGANTRKWIILVPTCCKYQAGSKVRTPKQFFAKKQVGSIFVLTAIFFAGPFGNFSIQTKFIHTYIT